MTEQREGRRPLSPGGAFNPLVMEDVPELPGLWLKHIQASYMCLTGEGMDDIWEMAMQGTSSLMGHAACNQEELLLCWGISWAVPLAPWMHRLLLPEMSLPWRW